MTDSELQKQYGAVVTRYTIKNPGKTHAGRSLLNSQPIHIEAREQRDGSTRWAITQCGNCLRKDGLWELEPSASYRTDEWLDIARYESCEEAFSHLANVIRKNETNDVRDLEGEVDVEFV